MILGHACGEVIKAAGEALKKGTSYGAVTKHETELARLITGAIPSVDQVRLTNSGTEAVMGAVRLARAYTKRDLIIKFKGAYHGHADYLLVDTGSGGKTFGVPSSKGVPEGSIKDTIILPFNDTAKLEDVFKKYGDKIAAVITEPVMANCGVVIPTEGFLESLRSLTWEYGSLLIFDEVITGFRLSYGGAQEYYGVRADITCLGKIIGGGFPVGAFGGSRKIMGLLAPLGDVYQAGTLSGNPVAVAAGIKTLKKLRQTNPYPELKDKAIRLCEGLRSAAGENGVNIRFNRVESMFSFSFGYDDIFKKFFCLSLEEGIYFSPSMYETNFISVKHGKTEIDRTIKAVNRVFSKKVWNK
jgi:glutamate-1-semialdehyde 2,1-aminomutase